MRTRTMVGTAAVAAMALLASACSGGSDGTSAATTSTVPPGAPAEVTAAAGDWVLPGHDYDNSRAAVSTIDATNVRGLAKAWSHEVSGSLSTVPLIVGDTVYLQDGSGRISALDRATGDLRWESEAYGLNIGPFGVAVADGRVYGMHGSKGVVALDAATGRELWVKDITATPTTGIDIQPTVYDGLVLVSTVPVSIGGIYKGGDRGIINALDAVTGEVRWTFDTVLGDDLWGNPEVNSGGGAWYPPAIDTEQGLVFWGVANPAPFPGTPEFPNGSSRPGDNLYTDSAVALDVTTGELRWFHQVHPHDIFDRDLVHTLIARPADGAADRGRHRQGRRAGGPRPHHGRRARGAPRSAITRTTTSPSCPARPWWPRAPSAASSRRRPPPTASSTWPPSTRRSPSSRTPPPTSAPSPASSTARWSRSTPPPAPSSGRRRCPAIRSGAWWS